MAAVPDARLNDIASIVHPERVVPTTIEFLDVAGLVRGASRGEGLGNQFLGHIRNADAIALVVRCFRDPQVPHVAPELDPRDDIAVIQVELALADLATVERRLEKIKSAAKSGTREYEAELALLPKVQQMLSQGKRVHGLAAKEEKILRPLNLLTAKPLIYVANVDEADLPAGGELAAPVIEAAKQDGAQALIVCARLEAELTEWALEEAAAYRAELGLVDSGLDRFIHASYALLNLITFFTTTGGKEVRAWTLGRETTAWDAAGRVHTDMQRGFIRAEVVPYAVLARERSFVAIRDKGLLHLEGREYVVQDGDIIHFRFAV
jgi:GTP-binding protein YchF